MGFHECPRIHCFRRPVIAKPMRTALSTMRRPCFRVPMPTVRETRRRMPTIRPVISITGSRSRQVINGCTDPLDAGKHDCLHRYRLAVALVPRRTVAEGLRRCNRRQRQPEICRVGELCRRRRRGGDDQLHGLHVARQRRFQDFEASVGVDYLRLVASEPPSARRQLLSASDGV